MMLSDDGCAATEADRKLFDEVVLQTRSQLLAVLERMVSLGDAEELVQEAYLRVYIRLDQLRGEDLHGYLFRTARNLAVSHLRHEKVVSQSEARLQIHQSILIDSPDSAVQIDAGREKQLLIDAINQLPPICRKVFICRKIDGMTHLEIAELLQISTHTVENHLARGMRRCREFLRQAAEQASVQAGARSNVR